MKVRRTRRIGIYPGTFDPVHAGHISFALQAFAAGKLDKLYLLPERRPPNKNGVEHFGHRVAMLKRATKPYTKFDVIELVDISFSVKRTLPQLQHRFPGDQLIFLFGSDVITNLPDWPQSDQFLKAVELIIGGRYPFSQEKATQLIATWPVQPLDLKTLQSYAPEVSSSSVREALYNRRGTRGLLQSVQRYSDIHWLYVRLPEASLTSS